MNASRRPVKAGAVCSDSATSTSQAAQADQSKNTRGGDFNEAHTNVIESDVVAPIDTHSDGVERATSHKPVESVSERGLQFNVLIVNDIAILDELNQKSRLGVLVYLSATKPSHSESEGSHFTRSLELHIP